jgi:hypothetical protein
MALRPIDRRGLGEVIAWSSALGMLGLLLLTSLIKKGEMDPVLVGSFSGLITALLARGAQSASERSGREDVAHQLEDAAKGYARRAEEAARRAEEAQPK